MTTSLISLLSILVGIITPNVLGNIFKKYSFGLIGNTIAGVFGSILAIKSLGRLGFAPAAIMHTGSVDYTLLIINFLISALGGGLALFLIHKLKKWMS